VHDHLGSRLPLLKQAVPAASVLLAGLAVLTLSHGPLGRPAPAEADSKPVQLTTVPVHPADHASRSRSVLPVARLTTLRTPDLMVSLPHLTARQVADLRDIRGVKALTVLRAGTVDVDGHRLTAAAVDPSALRGLTPRETASSDALWAAVARGEVVSSYSAHLPLGIEVGVTRAVPLRLRVAGLASFGLPKADLVVNRTVGEQLGLPLNVVVLAAPDRRIKTLRRDVRQVLGTDADIQVVRPATITYRRPATYRELYQLSAQYCPGLSWKVLAAIGQLESSHGRNVRASKAGALGPMQFMPATWAWAGVDGDGDGRADIMSAYDAVPAAALYLCRNGAGRGGQSLYNAIDRYNHADWYVREVLDLAARY
jgi:hypothetical protein